MVVPGVRLPCMTPASRFTAFPHTIPSLRKMFPLAACEDKTLPSSQEKFSFFRRDIVFPALAAALTSVTGVTAAASFPMMEEPDLPRFRRTSHGVQIQEVIEGKGAAASERDQVEFNYVCRRSNGYFVYSTVNQFTGESMPVTLSLYTSKMIPGLKDVILGMKPGGKRRALIPPEVGYVSIDLEPQPQEFGPRRSLFSHAKEPLLFEVQLLKIK